MDQRYFRIILVFISGMAAVIGCVPSEETGAGNRAKSPVQILGPIDTTHRVMHHVINQDTTLKLKNDSMKTTAVKKPLVAPKFKSHQDTVHIRSHEIKIIFASSYQDCTDLKILYSLCRLVLLAEYQMPCEHKRKLKSILNTSQYSISLSVTQNCTVSVSGGTKS